MTQGFYLGLMSGTSLDGVDAVLADLSAAQPRVLACASLPYADALRAEILALQPVGDNELDRAARLAQQLARLYA
ncbi:anhydro-N-acetylmuramic acid kinase, partial [Rivihabitans pingtungensis]